MGLYEDFLRRGKNYGKDGVEFYEDTHDEGGNYRARSQSTMQSQSQPQQRASVQEQQRLFSQNSYQASQFAAGQTVSVNAGRKSAELMIYEPNTPEDVQTLIDFLKRREPAIINLDRVDEAVSQRILDFVSGAVYALNGSVHRISGNIFVLSPEGVAITLPIEKPAF